LLEFRGARFTVFAGDDTWSLLFPDAFTRMFPYPSFHVWDIDTVDNGVASVLLPCVNATPTLGMFGGEGALAAFAAAQNRTHCPVAMSAQWNLFVGHFLGVDHVGHTFEANVPLMGDKLAQLDRVIAAVAESIGNNTLLVVMGDHGAHVVCHVRAVFPSRCHLAGCRNDGGGQPRRLRSIGNNCCFADVQSCRSFGWP
jgi:predicted AlkP superfamily pyrophosphatase or phosphodiesterase